MLSGGECRKLELSQPRDGRGRIFICSQKSAHMQFFLKKLSHAAEFKRHARCFVIDKGVLYRFLLQKISIRRLFPAVSQGQRDLHCESVLLSHTCCQFGDDIDAKFSQTLLFMCRIWFTLGPSDSTHYNFDLPSPPLSSPFLTC